MKISKESSQAGGEVVADAAKDAEFLIVGAGGCGGVGDAPVNALGSAGTDRALLGGVIADGDYSIEALSIEFGNGLRAIRRDVDTNFVHGFDGERMNITAGVAPRAIRLDDTTADMAKKPLSHLAAYAIAGA